jgi:predicted Ser/Thr protein kinase
MSLPVPFGRYELLERVAMGGMAEVFRARAVGREGFSKEVCIKRILPQFCSDPDFVRMFIDEAKLAARLQHANIVQIFDFDQVEGSYYIAMEYVQGRDLRAVVRQAVASGGPLPAVMSALLAAEICKGLHHAHQLEGLGLVHRDISPHNVLVGMNGEVKVADFGIAKAADRITHTGTGMVKGKAAYMAPEQAAGGEIDHRVDQFATGLVLFEMLTGRRAYDGGEIVALRKALDGDVQPPSLVVPSVPPELDEIFEVATQRDPARRYPDMRAMERALTQFVYRRDPADEEVDVAGFMRGLFRGSQPPAPAARGATAPVSAPGRGATLPRSLPAVTADTEVDEQAPTAMSDPHARLSGGLPPPPAATRTLQAATPRPRATPGPPRGGAPGHSPSPAVGQRAVVIAGGGGAVVAALVVTLALWPSSSAPNPAPEVRVTLPAPSSVPVAVPVANAGAPPPDAGTGPLDAGVGPVDAAVLRPAPRGKGHVHVISSRGWAEVHLKGGRRLGETPLDEELPAGRHVLVFRNPETGAEAQVPVTVRSRARVTVLSPFK